MKTLVRILILCVLLASLFLKTGICQQGEQKLFFDNGVQKYFKGDLKGSVDDLERAYSLDRTDEKTKKFLVKALVGLGGEYFNKKDYSSSQPLLKRAYELSPQDPGVKDSYDRLSSALKAEQERKRVLEEEGKKKEEEAKALEAQKAQEEERHRAEAERARKAEEERRKKDMQDRQAVETRRLDELRIKQEERRMIEIAEQKKGEEKREKSALMRTLFMGLILLVCGILIIIVISGTLRERTMEEMSVARQESQKVIQASTQHAHTFTTKVDEYNKGIKSILTNQMEKILKIMEDQTSSATHETVKMVVTRPDGKKEIITDINPRVRARANGVELIEQTIDDIATGEKLLSPFLNDRDSRVRANAAKGMYKYNREKAMVALNEMCKSQDEWMRLSGAWAMGEIGNSVCMDVLVSLLRDPKDFVAERAVRSLEKILEKSMGQLDVVVQTNITSALRDAKKRMKKD